MNYQPSKPFIWTMLLATPLLAALYFGLLPEVDALENPKLTGQIRFPTERPSPDAVPGHLAGSARFLIRDSIDWLEKGYEDLMSWERNPWKSKRLTFGSHYFQLRDSKNPLDQARVSELRRLADALHRRILERWPELAIADRSVPPERNGFLRWLELSERIDADPDRPGPQKAKSIGIPEALAQHLANKGPWDAAAARALLARERPLLDEVRAIGLLTERSTAGIDVDRYGFISARLGKECSELLLIDARLAAENGNTAAALESIRAARGLADHFGAVENPTLLAATVQILLQQQVQSYALGNVMPALPTGQLDPVVWQSALNPVVSPPAEFARLMTGEWNVTARQYLLPVLVDTEDPKYPSDPEALIDYHAGSFVRIIGAYSGSAPSDWPATALPPPPDTSHLSRESRELMEILFVGARACSRGMQRSQSMNGLTQAAFALMKGQPLPVDPIYGLPYRWDPGTRILSPPDTPEFQDMNLKPVVVPAPR